MASWSKMNTGTKTAVRAAIVILFGGGGYGLWHALQPPAVETTQAVNGATALSEVVADAAPPVADVAAPAVDVAAPAAAGGGGAPSMDLVRIEPDGTALVAGQAPAGALVTLLANAVEVASTKADPAGKFVAIFRLPPSASGQMLTMVVTLPDGSTVAATTQVAIATITAPVVVADAGPAAPDSAATVTPATDAPTPTALAVTDSGVKVLQSGTAAPAEVAANVSVDLIAYPSPDAVQFGGHGTAGQFIRLYLDNVALGEPVAIAADGTWSVTLVDIAPGIHTLRVDQVDGSGKVTSRFETPFKRETPEALAAASGAAAPETVVADAVATADAPDATVTAPAADSTAAAPTAATTATAAATTADTTTAATTTAATTTAPAAPATVEAASTAPALPATEAPAVGKAPAATV
ncbi:MAG: hypothetical protein H7317_19360, partial [Pseudorhodobacter sp.]|nr:hypothetical protein [Pseudorhodobacter sp.]